MANVKSKSPTTSSETAGGNATNPTPEWLTAAHQTSAEERERHQSFLAFVRAKEQSWAAMSPAERAASEAMWEAAAKNINEVRAGHRKVFVG